MRSRFYPVTLIIFHVFTHFAFTQNLSPIAQDSALQQRYAHALMLLGEEKYPAVISELQSLVNNYPQFYPAYRKITDAYLLSEDLEAAQSVFRKMIDADSSNAYAYYALARIDQKQKNYDAAIEKLKKCIALKPDFSEAYSVQGGLPEAFHAKKDLAAGKQFFRGLIMKMPENAFGYYGLGRLFAFENDWENAEKFLKKSISLKPVQEFSYSILQYVYETQGNYKKGIENGRQFLNAAIQLKDFEVIAYALTRLGGMQFRLGDLRKALENMVKSLTIARKIGAKKREGMALLNIGAIQATLGNYEKAVEYFEKSLGLLQKIGAKRSEIRTLMNIGLLNKDMKQYPAAFEYFSKALDKAGDNAYANERGLIFNGMGEAYAALKAYEKARVYYHKSRTIFEELNDKFNQGYISGKIADLDYARGNYEKALTGYQKALQIGEELQGSQIIWEAHAGLGACFEKLDNAGAAIANYQNAIANYDSIRQDLDIESLTSSFLNDKYEVYPSLIQLLAQQQQYAAAFDYLERYKAKTMLQILSGGRFLLESALPDSVRYALVENRDQLADAHAQRAAELAKPADARDEQRLLNLDRQITDLQLKKSALIEWVKRNFSAYYQLTTAGQVNLRKLQNDILTPGQLLLEYVVGPEKTSVFAITRDTLLYRAIPVARDSLVKKLGKMSAIFHADASRGASRLFSAEQADFSIAPAFSLYEMLLKPFQNLWQQSDELIIAPDDFLNYLPFEALVIDTTAVQNRYDFAHAKFLIETANIRYSPAASLLDPALKRDHHPRKSVLAMGNPDFQTPGGPAQTNRGNIFLPLPHSEAEVKSIGALLPFDEKDIRTGKAASETVFKREASEFRVLHLASHFEINDVDPLYSRVVLSQSDNSGEDGFLYTYEVFGLQLNADLVTLSACNTALGKMSKGEGLIGISRAFLYSGVPGMILSLWSVDDEAANQVMENFYRYLQSGVRKDKALRQAKLDYLKTSNNARRDPFFWAPFILVGDAAPIPLPAGYPLGMFIAVGVVGVIMLIGGFLFWRRKQSVVMKVEGGK